MVRLAPDGCREVVARVHSFNPSLVRLAPLGAKAAGAVDVSFNPSLVRLAHGRRCPALHRVDHFQSQLGSIGAPGGRQTPQPHACLSIPAWFDWRGLRGWRASWRPTPFNPSLVRLALLLGYLLSGRPIDFQSQLGSIGALAPAWVRRLTFWLSIPAWFDWRATKAPGVVE